MPNLIHEVLIYVGGAVRRPRFLTILAMTMAKNSKFPWSKYPFDHSKIGKIMRCQWPWSFLTMTKAKYIRGQKVKILTITIVKIQYFCGKDGHPEI